jgi:hypothetical protein
MWCLLDSDILGYRVAFACKNEKIEVAKRILDKSIIDILMGCDHDDRFYDEWKLFLTGKNNFRLEVATTAVYKGNRTAPKPLHLPLLREHMVKEWGAFICDGYEADDGIATEATALGDDCIMVSVDKDFDQVKGWHYNFIKKRHYYVTEDEGNKAFYMQMLMGDGADNIKGLHLVGKVRAAKMLEECVSPKEMYDVCVEAYGSEERVKENALLLWLRRHPDEMWEPPK